MTINNDSAYLASLWDWGILNGCFDTDRDRVGDLDGHVERNGYHLILETKLPGVRVGYGQMLAYKQLSMLRDPRHSVDTGMPSVIVLIIWGTPGQPESCQMVMRGEAGNVQPCDAQRLRSIVSKWHQRATAAGKPRC